MIDSLKLPHPARLARQLATLAKRAGAGTTDSRRLMASVRKLEALAKVEVTHRGGPKSERSQPTVNGQRSHNPAAPKPPGHRDVKLSAALRKQMRIAELMKVAARRGAVDLALSRLAAGFPLSEIEAEICGTATSASMAAAINSAYDKATGRAAAPARAPMSATARAIIAAGDKAIRLPR